MEFNHYKNIKTQLIYRYLRNYFIVTKHLYFFKIDLVIGYTTTDVYNTVEH